ncbi:MAG: GAF domain-containing protein [Mycobacterium sp.]
MNQPTPHATDTTSGLADIAPRLEELARQLGVKSVLVMRSDPDAMVVAATAGEATRHYTVGASGRKAGQDDSRVPLYCERVVDTDSAVYVRDSREDPRFAGNEDEAEFGLSNYLGMAVHDARGRVVGTVCVLDDHARHYDDDDRTALHRLRAAVESVVQRDESALD